MDNPTPNPMPDPNEILRHILAAFAFRTTVALRDAPAAIATTRLADGTMTATELLNHMTILINLARYKLFGGEFQRTEPADWGEQQRLFYSAIATLDSAAAENRLEDGALLLNMLQGPILDSFTHIGQLSTMRRLAGSPPPPLNYMKAEIVTGRVGPEQTF